MSPTRGEQIYDGKAKNVFATDDPDLVILHFKDDATAFNGVKHAVLDDKGQMSVSPYVQRYITGEYYKKSVRCRGCALNATCKGMHIQFLRAHGFGSLQPIPTSDETRSAA